MVTRRHFFYGSLLAGAIPSAGFGSVPALKTLGYKSPNEKLNIASIGAGGKAASDIDGCSSENIVALCDVDDESAAKKFKEYEKVPKYRDFRKMIDEQGSISTPSSLLSPISCMPPRPFTAWSAASMSTRRSR